jgi:AcrR family transcriptional regulator
MQMDMQTGADVRGRGGRLSPEQIGRAGLEIVDREGLEALSMRRLADALGVGTMTLYGYVRSKDEVIDAIIDVAVALAEPAVLRGTWRDQLAALMRTRRRNLNAHPALVAIRFTRPIVRPEALRFGEAGMRILTSAGFDAEEAARAFRLLYTFVFGYAGLSPDATTEQARRQVAVAVAGLPPDEYRALMGAAPEFSAATAGDEAFEYGLELILDGLEARLASRPRKLSPRRRKRS